MLFADLEPCPKCGSKAIWFKLEESLDGNYGNYEFYCEDCKYNVDISTKWPENREEAIRKWNEFALYSIAKSELKPCPFCGSKKIFINHENETKDMPEWYLIYCGNCDANTGKHRDLNSVLNSWNTRHKF